ncbi:MAG: cyclase family protein [Chloroflexota bacterium]
MSRRRFLQMGAVAAAQPRLSTHASDLGGTIVDLSHVLGEDFPTYPGIAPAQRTEVISIERNSLYAQAWTFNEHTGTHMDAPAHIIADGATVPELPPEMLIGPAVVIDIDAAASENADAMVTIDDITTWEATNGTIPPGAYVFMYSGWAEVLANRGANAYYGRDANNRLHFPGFSPQAAQFLVNERDIKGVGTDTFSIDTGNALRFDVHFTVLGAGMVGIENLANLAAIKDTVATVILGIPKYRAGSGGPLRVLAFH